MIRIAVMLCVLCSACSFGQEALPQWKFYCLYHDVAIIEGTLSKLSEKELDLLDRSEASCRFFAEGDPESGAFIEMRSLRAQRIHSANSIIGSLFTGGGKTSLSVKKVFRRSGVKVSPVTDGPGLYVVMWSPIMIDAPLIVVAELDASDLAEAMKVRQQWVELRKRDISEESGE